MEDLLSLTTAERAEALRLHVGTPPVIVLRGEQHIVEGPPITAENAEELLRSIADTRQVREFRERGAAEFGYTFRGSSYFLVHATMEGENVGLDLQSHVA